MLFSFFIRIFAPKLIWRRYETSIYETVDAGDDRGSDGVTFTKLVEKRVNNNIVKPTQYFDYVANGSNKALIILEFKAVGKVASSRGLDAVEPAGDGGVETIHW